jgi:hypothetical protein
MAIVEYGGICPVDTSQLEQFAAIAVNKIPLLPPDSHPGLLQPKCNPTEGRDLPRLVAWWGRGRRTVASQEFEPYRTISRRIPAQVSSLYLRWKSPLRHWR